MSYSFDLANTPPYIEYNRVVYQGTPYIIEKIEQIIINNKTFQKITTDDNIIFFFYNNCVHNENDHPAIIWADGSEMWFKNGLLHREQGLPAIRWHFFDDGVEEFWIKGKKITKEEALKKKLSSNIKEF